MLPFFYPSILRLYFCFQLRWSVYFGVKLDGGVGRGAAGASGLMQETIFVGGVGHFGRHVNIVALCEWVGVARASNRRGGAGARVRV